MKHPLTMALPFMLLAQGAFAQDYQAKIQAFHDTKLRNLITAPELVAAIAAANTARAGMDRATIDTMDTAWKAEVGTAATPTISPILEKPAADVPRGQVDAAGIL